MNNTIYYDAAISDDLRRKLLFEGQLFVYSPVSSSIAFIEFAKSMIEDAFGGRDPRVAQDNMAVEDYAALLAKLKPEFIHHPESKRHLQNIFEEMGVDRTKTYFDVPRMRSSTSGGYLTTGIAYAWHAHRDTWFSAPSCQINWWMPIYEIASDNAMAFHPGYWTQPVKNSSSGYNYYQWNNTAPRPECYEDDKGRQPTNAARHRANGSRSANSLDMPGWRHDLVLGRTDAFERPEYFGSYSIQYRLSHCSY